MLHSPGKQADNDGPERDVQCDYWRLWSNETGNAEQNDMALRGGCPRNGHGVCGCCSHRNLWFPSLCVRVCGRVYVSFTIIMFFPEIAEFYKFGGPRPGTKPQGSSARDRPRRAPQIPNLKSITVWSDGQRSQYKGEPNFGRMSIWPKSVQVGKLRCQRKGIPRCPCNYLGLFALP